MSEYLVEWQIDICADTPEQAAMAALQIQRDPTSMATVFSVLDEEGNTHQVDLLTTTKRDYWDEHPVYSSEDWRYEVMNGDTRLGYWEWTNKREQEDDDEA